MSNRFFQMYYLKRIPPKRHKKSRKKRLYRRSKAVLDLQCKAFHLNGVQTELNCKPNVKRCKRFVFPEYSPLLYHNTLKTKAIKFFQADHILTRFVFPPLYDNKKRFHQKNSSRYSCTFFRKHTSRVWFQPISRYSGS